MIALPDISGAAAVATAGGDIVRVFEDLCVNGSARFAKGELEATTLVKLPTDVRAVLASLPLGEDRSFRGELHSLGPKASEGAYYRIKLKSGQYYAGIETRTASRGSAPVRVCSVIGSRIPPRYVIEKLGLSKGDATQQALSDQDRGFAEWTGVPLVGYKLRVNLWGLRTMLQSTAPDSRILVTSPADSVAAPARR
ncbi:MAG: hypothetical protein JWO65_1569 [Sphingomonas bacterium]|nr:hypothetical protein [Sphingomonas bacterium]